MIGERKVLGLIPARGGHRDCNCCRQKVAIRNMNHFTVIARVPARLIRHPDQGAIPRNAENEAINP